jgi:crotonobetainyl-CoA:carnitine CoA-transferase CaiB-like acyl-CoA transferase
MTDCETPQAPRLLDGIRVLSFCHYLQGPAAAQYLADMGADVIKVEPKNGAFERHWSGANTYVDDVSAFFVSANRNKRSVALDLKHKGTRRVLDRLVASADVIIENYRPGVMERLGLGYEAVKAIRPDIIYASATGFGADGPLRDKPGQDLLVQARSGLMASTGSTPTVTGCAAVDQHGAALLAMGISAACFAKLSTGKGTRIEGSLFNAGIDMQMEALTLYYTGERSRERFERDPHLGTWFHEAPYGVYQLSDAFIVISLNPVAKIAEALDSDRLRGMASLDAYAERDRIAAALSEVLAPLNFATVAARFDPLAIWYEKVNDYDDLRVDPQAIYNGIFTTIPVAGGEATIVNHPLKYDGAVPSVRRLPPKIGEHGQEILAELGFSSEEIDRLFSDGALALSNPS